MVMTQIKIDSMEYIDRLNAHIEYIENEIDRLQLLKEEYKDVEDRLSWLQIRYRMAIQKIHSITNGKEKT